jgi:predicted MPP superfamily phosphohydrolase
VDTAPSGHRLGFALGIAALLVPAVVLLYAFFVEPYSIELTRHALAADVLQPLKIAHLTDLHSRGYGTRERQVVALVDQAAPDLIVVTGDVVDSGSLEPAREMFQRLRAPLGVWVVRGNAERARAGADDLTFFRSVDAHLLDNQGVPVRNDVWLVGLDDPLTGHPDLRGALVGAPAASFKVALFHSPDHFAEVAGLFNLGLAGHTHGGQVRFPGLGSLWLPPDAHAYVSGWYTKNRSQLYVSRGIGTTVVPARFLARPEIALIEIRPN